MRDSLRSRTIPERPRAVSCALAGKRSSQRAFLQAAFASLLDPGSHAYYNRKRTEGKRHNQAVLALTRRKVDVLWAMLCDGTPYRPPAAKAA